VIVAAGGGVDLPQFAACAKSPALDDFGGVGRS
jgi:hypothetical protein